MSNTTKQNLEASLKKVMLQKPLDKITISDITSDCGISRMAFYYHFKDIYDLVEWSCVEDGTKAVSEKDGTNLVFTFPDSWNALPKVVEMQVSGLDVLEGNSYVNNNVPGYEFG